MNSLTRIRKDQAMTQDNHRGPASKSPRPNSWRVLQVSYSAISIFIIIFSFVAIQIYNSQESCTTQTTMRTEGSYHKSGPQNWNNSYYEYKVPETSSSCSTKSDSGTGISLWVVGLLLVLSVIGYLFLPKLHRYMHLQKPIVNQ